MPEPHDLTPAEIAEAERLGRADYAALTAADRAADPGVTEGDLIDCRLGEAERRAAGPEEATDWTDISW